jgi:hypothetical protein
MKASPDQSKLAMAEQLTSRLDHGFARQNIVPVTVTIPAARKAIPRVYLDFVFEYPRRG